MQDTLIPVIADDREKKSDVVDELLRLPQVRLTIQRLPVGDYLVADRLLFERKTLVDLVASIKDGRLFTQARRLAAAKGIPALILQGTGSDLRSQGMSREAIQGALVSLAFRFGIPVLRARDGRECVSLMLYAAGQTADGKKVLLRRPAALGKSKQRRQLYILQGLPGVGDARSRHLLERFQTPANVFTASVDELKQVQGIGRIQAEKIYSLIHENPAEYRFSAGHR
ncbi:MAG: excinuclease ABC subunit C [bacterium ADurb.Bin478]|nr:MAG: excinuclease ABC subunit C [bacterium ADurb.Bin478]